MADFRPAKRRIKVSVGESVRIVRELQGLSQNHWPSARVSHKPPFLRSKMIVFASGSSGPRCSRERLSVILRCWSSPAGKITSICGITRRSSGPPASGAGGCPRRYAPRRLLSAIVYRTQWTAFITRRKLLGGGSMALEDIEEQARALTPEERVELAQAP